MLHCDFCGATISNEDTNCRTCGAAVRRAPAALAAGFGAAAGQPLREWGSSLSLEDQAAPLHSWEGAGHGVAESNEFASSDDSHAPVSGKPTRTYSRLRVYLLATVVAVVIVVAYMVLVGGSSGDASTNDDEPPPATATTAAQDKAAEAPAAPAPDYSAGETTQPQAEATAPAEQPANSLSLTFDAPAVAEVTEVPAGP